MGKFDKTDLRYFTSERFIHDDLLARAAAGVESLYRTWREEGRIDPFFIAWPAEPVQTREGSMIAGPCMLELPADRRTWNKKMLEAMRLTRAYAILLTEQRDEDVRVILESPHGARCWTVPIERHGDVRALGRASSQDDGPCLGILWKPGQTTD